MVRCPVVGDWTSMTYLADRLVNCTEHFPMTKDRSLSGGPARVKVRKPTPLLDGRRRYCGVMASTLAADDPVEAVRMPKSAGHGS